MVSYHPVQLIKQMKRLPTLSQPRLITPAVRFFILETIIAGLVGILAGGYLIIISVFYPPRWLQDIADISLGTWKLLLIMIAIAPFAGLVVTKVVFGNLRKLLLAVVLIDIATQIDKNLMVSDRALHFGAVSGFSISVTTIGLAILYLWWTVDILSKRSAPPPRALFFVNTPLLAYVVIFAISTLVAHDISLVIFELNLIVQGVLLYFYIIYTTRTWRDVLFIITMFLIGLVPFSLITIWLSLSGGLKEQATTVTSSVFSRADGPMGSPNVAGSYIMMTLLPLFGVFAITEVRGWYKWLIAPVIALGGGAVLVTGSRGAWGGLAIAILMLCWLTWRRGWLSIKIPAIYLILALLLVLPFYDVILERLWGDVSTNSAESRTPLNELAIRMILDHPIFGVGGNNFAQSLPEYVNAEFAGLWINTVHNKYLLVWTETGILGLVAFVGFLLTTLYQGWQVWQGHHRLLSTFALSFSLSLVGAMIHMTVEIYHSRAQIQMLCLLAGTVTAIYNMYRYQCGETTPVDPFKISFH